MKVIAQRISFDTLNFTTQDNMTDVPDVRVSISLARQPNIEALIGMIIFF